MSVQRNLSIAALGLVVVIGLGLGLRPTPVLVEVSEVKKAPMEVVIEEEGKTRVKDRYVISAPVTGYLRRIDLEIGDSVKPGQILTQLEPLPSNVLDPRSRAEAEARVAAARSGLLAAEEQVVAVKANADYAASEYQRHKALKVKNLISEETLSLSLAEKQRTQALLRSARFAVEVSRHELNAASTLLRYSAAQTSPAELKERVNIKAPVSGSVLSLHHKSEGVVIAGSPLVEIGDPSGLEVAVDVLSFDAVQIKKGMKVKLERWGGDTLDGIVRVVEPVGFTKVSALGVEEQRVWVIIDINAPTEQWLSLGDGYRVEAKFLLWQNDAALQIPNASLFKKGQQWAVYHLVNDEIKIKTVEIGQRNGLNAQLLSGLSEGDKIIVHPGDDIKPGVRVKVR